MPNGTLPPSGNASQARNAFALELENGFEIEEFESFALSETPPLSIFDGSKGVLATVTGDAVVENIAGGRFPTSGVRQLETLAGGSITLTFSERIFGLGFFATDAADFFDSLEVALTNELGDSIFLLIEAPQLDGNLLFWGFTDRTKTYNTISICNVGGAGDSRGFDDFLVAFGTQIGDINRDGFVDLLDVEPFVEVLSNGHSQNEADINRDGVVNLLDIAPFVELLTH